MDRAKTPWLVFAGHRPMYVNSGGAGAGDCEGPAAMEPNCANDQPVAKLLRDTLERLLLEYEVGQSVDSAAQRPYRLWYTYCCTMHLFL